VRQLLSMLKNTRLVKLSSSFTANFMQKFEHLGNVGLGVWHWGLEFDGKIAAAVTYGTTCFSTKRGWLARMAREVDCGIIQLCRGGSAQWSPNGTASRLIALANRAMYKLRGTLLVVAYADPELCEIGTIYQACNAIYTGLTEPKGQANYIIHGEKLSGWQVRKRYGTRDPSNLFAIDSKHQVLPLNKKYRYIMITGPPCTRQLLRKLITPYALPYPKREKAHIGQMVHGTLRCL